MEENKDGMVPEQYTGAHKDLKESISLENTDDAEDMFLLCKERLLHVSNWGKLIEGATATFTLCDKNGHEVHRSAHTGDYIKIDIPGPGNVAGDGNDWVIIEAIEYDDYPDDNGEILSMRVRPSTAPTNDNADTAHFFQNSATSTFSIQRLGKLVMAQYHGRNEVANTDTEHVTDAIRNKMVAAGAIAALSDWQWDKLLKALIRI